MMVHSYPLLISLYKGEGRVLIVPLIDHVAGYSIDSDWFINLSDVNNALSVGEGVTSALDYIINSPLSSLPPKERKENAAWKKNTKYRSRVALCRCRENRQSCNRCFYRIRTILHYGLDFCRKDI